MALDTERPSRLVIQDELQHWFAAKSLCVAEVLMLSTFVIISVFVSPADEKGKYHPKLPAESPGSPQKGLQ